MLNIIRENKFPNQNGSILKIANPIWRKRIFFVIQINFLAKLIDQLQLIFLIELRLDTSHRSL